MLEEKELVKVEEPKAPIVIDEIGFIKPKDISEFHRLATMLLRSGMVPKRFTNPEQVMAGMQYALELGLKPLSGLKNITLIQGSPCLFGEGPLSLVMSSGKLEDIHEYFIDKDGKTISHQSNNLDSEVYGAVCVVKRKGVATKMESTFTMKDAETAKLLKNPVWLSYRGRMLKFRARGAALKDLFPDCIGGIAQLEFDYPDAIGAEFEKGPVKNTRKESELL